MVSQTQSLILARGRPPMSALPKFRTDWDSSCPWNSDMFMQYIKMILKYLDMNGVVCKNVELHEVREVLKNWFRKFMNVKVGCELLTLGPQWICGLGQCLAQEYLNWSRSVWTNLNYNISVYVCLFTSNQIKVVTLVVFQFAWRMRPYEGRSRNRGARS